MNKRFINTYIKYTAKKPILFFAMILVGVLSIIVLSLSTKTSVVISSDGMVACFSITVDGEFNSCTNFIYAYIDRNEYVYSIEISNTIHEAGKTIFFFNTNEYIFDNKEIKVDIPIREITIFERVFLKGGKVNG